MTTLNLVTRTIFDGVYRGTTDVTVPGELIDLVHSTEPLPSAMGDRWLAKTGTLAGASTTFDLRETGANLTDKFGTTISLSKLTGFEVRNRTATTAKVLTVTLPGVTDVLAGTTPSVKVGPSGRFFWESPVDGADLTDESADTIVIDPGADTIDYELYLYGVAV